MASAEIPNRSVFRAAEVCEMVGVQAYVLRSWEAEFPDLGVSKTAGAPRIYRRPDVERVRRIKELILVEGLTLAGARRKLTDEGVVAPVAPPAPVTDEEVSSLLDAEARESLRAVRSGLEWILGMLSGEADGASAFELRAEVARAARPGAPRAAHKRATPAKPPAKPAKKRKK